MVRHHRVRSWEKQLRKVLARIDHELERKYGAHYPLHPARARHGVTGNARHDGLFRLNAHFTPGFGSALGRGYLVDIEMITLARVARNMVREVEDFVQARLEQELPLTFPERDLHVERDGSHIKIVGDLSLGSA